MPPRRQGDTTAWIESWESYAEQQVREAIEGGAFDNLPGSGRPITFADDNPFEGDLGPAYRLARNAGVTPGWVSIGREVEACLATLDALLAAIPRWSPRADVRPASRPPIKGWRSWVRQFWLGSARSVTPAPNRLACEAKEVARARFLERAAHADARIRAFNAQLPRTLAWLERPRLTQSIAEARFDRAWASRSL